VQLYGLLDKYAKMQMQKMWIEVNSDPYANKRKVIDKKSRNANNNNNEKGILTNARLSMR